MPQQDPFKRKDNKKSTPTSSIAPGSPLWNAPQHSQKSYGQGYDHNDPVSLLKGTYSDGTSITRFGKFGFKKSFAVHGENHGTVFNIPILREEGAQGTWEIVISQDKIKSTGVLGNYRSTTENGYDVCKVDLDIWSMNEGKDGFSWSDVDKELTLTFIDGEIEKVIQAIVPYRTSCRVLLPEVLRQEITYRVQEFQSQPANNYDGKIIENTWNRGFNYYGGCGGRYFYYNIGLYMHRRYNTITSQEQITNITQSGIGTHSVYYNVYTLPMPRSWIENIVGNDVYLDKFDLNYTDRVTRNTHRPHSLPNRTDDLSQPDVAVQGIVARYDHTDKLELVLGKTRFTTFALRSVRQGTPRAGADYRFAYGKIWVSNDKRISHRYSKYVNSSLWASRILDTSTSEGIAGINRIISTSTDLISLYPLRAVPLMLTAGLEYERFTTGSTANKGEDMRYIEEQSGPYEFTSVIHPDMYTIGQMPLPQSSFDYTKQSNDPYYDYFYDAQPSGIDYSAQTVDKPTDNHHPTTNVHMFTPYQQHSSAQTGGSRWWSDMRSGVEKSYATDPYLLDIKHEHQSWYISTRYNITDAPAFAYTDAVFAGTPDANKYLETYPSDKILNVGNPFSGVGDIAHVMFNHHGTKPIDYYNNRPVHVMSYEDPSNIVDEYNTPEIDDEVITEKHSHGYAHWTCYSWCRYSCRNWRLNNRNTQLYGGQVSKYPHDQEYKGDWTDKWLLTGHDPLSAGQLDLYDAPTNSFDPTFTGYKWDGAQVDTSAGGGANARTGDGSPGHGEDGTSRYLYDCSDIVHPLSSYEVNDNNLKGHYLCCTDHVDTHITLKLEKKKDSDQFDLGEISMKLLINKVDDYDIRNHSAYDRRALPDHEIAVGPTYNMYQEWDATPTNASVTDRLFTSIGANTSSPVLFLGLTAAVIPGGSLTNPNADPEPLPANIVISPNTTLVDDTVSKGDTATYAYTFTNIGEQTGILKISNTFTPEKGVYTDGGLGNFTGDKVIDWSRTIQQPYQIGPSGFANTVSLSAGASVDVSIDLASTTDNPAGYVVSLNYTIDAPGKLISNKRIRFDVDV